MSAVLDCSVQSTVNLNHGSDGVDYHSPVGPLRISMQAGRLVGMAFVENGCAEHWPWVLAPDIQHVVDWLEAYFSGKKPSVDDLPLDVSCLPGTDFQKTCWHALLDIPYGQTWSYHQLAQHIGHANAMRAVGQANRKNPLPIVIPCHRVIRADGHLGGYMGTRGLTIKRQLLAGEGWVAQKS